MDETMETLAVAGAWAGDQRLFRLYDTADPQPSKRLAHSARSRLLVADPWRGRLLCCRVGTDVALALPLTAYPEGVSARAVSGHGDRVHG